MKIRGSRCLPAVLSGIVLLSLVTAAFSASLQDCNNLRKELEVKQKDLALYLEAMGKSRTEHDQLLLGALNYKIDELVTQIAVLEERIAPCTDAEEAAKTKGMSSVKSEEGKFATKSCGELRRLLVQFHRKVNAFKRRESSFLSELTAAEQSELNEAAGDLEKIRKILNSRCAAAPQHDSLKRRLR
jgi:hypothetical protein